MSTKVYYDGDCPFCARYVGLLRLQEVAGPVELVDLREQRRIKDELQSLGFDLDQGMVVEMNGQRVGGADAITQIALMTTPSTPFNKITKLAFSSPKTSKVLYPILTMGRWIVLFLLGRDPLNPNSDEGPKARAAIFSSMFGLFSIFHFFTYILQYGFFPPDWDLFLILITAILLVIRPQSSRLLWLLMLASAISAIQQAPVNSNHTIVRNFVVLGYWISFFYAVIKRLRPTDIFSNFAIAGQGTLFVMYFFGVFHKINRDFLNPDTSCAVLLWRKMPAPLKYLDTSWMHYLAIYGTFIVEGILVLMLMSRRFRHIAIVCGILFHLLLALSNHAMYITFTTLTISLHCLFLNEPGALRIQNSKFMAGIKARITSPIHFAFGIMLILALVFAALNREYALVTIFMLPIVLPFCYVIMRYGSSAEPLIQLKNKRPAWVIGSVLTGLFFVNCSMPYMGLKSAQSVNMFANLRLEGGVSNHLIMKNAPGPFKYLEEYVEITDSHGNRFLSFFTFPDRAMIYYDLLSYLDKNPEASVSYTKDGVSYVDVTSKDVAEDIETQLHPKWFRKWFHFQIVNLQDPEQCWN